MIDEGRAEAERLIHAMLPYAARGVPILGLEPSCLFALRDDILTLLPGADSKSISSVAMLFEEFLAREHADGRLNLKLNPLPQTKALLHGHCHQKAFDAVKPTLAVLKLVPGLQASLIESSCCGMAGAFGYEPENMEVSRRMAETSLLPAIAEADADTVIVADGTSCRHQIADGAEREAVHVASLLARALA